MKKANCDQALAGPVALDAQAGIGMFGLELPQEERSKVTNILNEMEDKLISTVIGNLLPVCACE